MTVAYLSRIWLNPLRSGAQRLLRNPQALHATVLGGLSCQPVTERVLWRLDVDAPHRAALLVLTRSRPSWEHIVEQAGWPSADEPQILIRAYEPLLDQVCLGREFALRVKANPVRSTKQPDRPTAAQKELLASQTRPRGLRLPHRTAEHQLDWVIDRLPRWGFGYLTGPDDLPAVRIVARERISFTRKSAAGRHGNPVVLQAATFEGLVRVDDVELARQSLLAGVGPGKAYGLGLITLAPPVNRAAP